MRENPRIRSFFESLAAAGVTYRRNWLTRRDGNPRATADVHHVAFVGDGFSPAIATAIIVDYGERDGFGLYVESRNANIEADVAAIAKRDPLRDAAPDMLKRLTDMRAAYGTLHDFLSDTIESGRLKEADIPDDYQAILRALEICGEADHFAGIAIAKAEGRVAMSVLEFQEVPTDRVEAARLAVDALRLARDCLKVAGATRSLDRVNLALSSAKGAVRAAGYRVRREAEGR